MAEKKRGLISKAFGTKAIKDVFGQTKGMLKDASPSKKQYVKETFDEAMKRHGITEEDENQYLSKIYKNLKVQFLIFFLGQIFLIALGVIPNIVDGSYFVALTYCFLTFALGTLTAQYGLRCFQIRKKHLGMLSSYLKTPSEWYPKKITIDYLENVEKQL